VRVIHKPINKQRDYCFFVNLHTQHIHSEQYTNCRAASAEGKQIARSAEHTEHTGKEGR